MSLYYLFNAIATGMLLVYNLLHYREKKKLLGGVSHSVMNYFAGKPQRGVYRVLSAAGIWTVVEIIIISFFQYYATGLFNTLLGDVLGTGANYFGNLFSAPLLVLLACILLKIEFLDQMDLITPAFPLALFFSKIGCYFAGCCRGVEWEGGFYNPTSRLIEFPAQLLEAGVALLLFIFLQCFKKKFRKGTIFPIYLTAFSGIRFFTEYTRWEPQTFFWLKTYQLLCIVGVLVGLAEYFAVCKYTARLQEKEKISDKM